MVPAETETYSTEKMEPSGRRRVLLVIDSSTRRVVSTRPLRPAGLDADAMLAEYMAYQQLLVRMQRRHSCKVSHTHTVTVTWPQVTSARDPPTSEPFLLRTHGESNEVGGACLGGMATRRLRCITLRCMRWQAGTCTSSFLTRRASGRGH